MGVKINHHEPPARRKTPGGFGERARRIIEEVQHLVDGDKVIAAALDGRRVDVALTQGDMPQARLIDMGARQRQRGRALVDADRARRPRSEKLERAPVPVPRSSGLRNGFAPIMATSAASTRSSGGVQRADLIPIGGARSAK